MRPDVPYKTLLLSTADTTLAVVREAMEKYGLEKEDPEEYCLVEVSHYQAHRSRDSCIKLSITFKGPSSSATF